jgi:hypothetical protein
MPGVGFPKKQRGDVPWLLNEPGENSKNGERSFAILARVSQDSLTQRKMHVLHEAKDV